MKIGQSSFVLALVLVALAQANTASANCNRLLDAMANVTEAAPAIHHSGTTAPGSSSTASKAEARRQQLLQVLQPSVNTAAYYPFYISFPLVFQYPYVSAAPAAMVAALKGFGVTHTTLQMGTLTGSGVSGNTDIRSVATAFSTLSGFTGTALKKQTVQSLRNLVAKGSTAVLVAYQRVLSPASTRTVESYWEATWESNHFALLIGMDRHNVYLMDPANQNGYIPLEEFESRWHTLDTFGEFNFCQQCAVGVEWDGGAVGVGQALMMTSRPSHLEAL